MKTRIILDIDMKAVDRDLLNRISLRAMKELSKSRASLVAVRTEEIKENEVYTDFQVSEIEKRSYNLDTYPDYKLINNGFIDDCIRIINSAREGRR